MYQVCVLSAERDRALAVASALRSQNLHSFPLDINTKIQFGKFQGFVVAVSNVSQIEKLQAKLFEFPCVLLCNNDKDFPEDLKFDRVFNPPYIFSDIAMYIKYLIFSHQSSFPESRIQVSDLVIKLDTREVKYGDKCLKLSNKEFCLLEFFMRHPDKAFTRNQILDRVWDYNSNLFTNTVDVHIGRLRRKLHAKMPEKFIKTVHGFGYLFRANPD